MQTMTAYTGNRDRVPLICKISTVLSFMLWLLYVCRHNTESNEQEAVRAPELVWIL